MRIRRKTEIKTETHEVVVVRRAGREAVAWCDGCGKQARFLALGEAMALSGASSREIHCRIESGGIHFAETTHGSLLIWLSSLLKPN